MYAMAKTLQKKQSAGKKGGFGQNTAMQKKGRSAAEFLKPHQKTEVPLKPDTASLPGQLKSGIENLSGFAMDDVRVHYNSPAPQKMQALAFTQGADIHIAPGQERHLAHEAWHVVQQKQGRVAPCAQQDGIPVNDSADLEREADRMGEKAML